LTRFIRLKNELASPIGTEDGSNLLDIYVVKTKRDL